MVIRGFKKEKMDETFLQKRLAVLRNFKKIEKKKRERLQLQSQK